MGLKILNRFQMYPCSHYLNREILIAFVLEAIYKCQTCIHVQDLLINLNYSVC